MSRDCAHAELDELEAYVMGLLAGEEKDRLEAHVVTCPRCAAALSAEAEREMALFRAMGRIARPQPFFERVGSWLVTLSVYRLRAWRARGARALRYLEATTTALPMAALAALVLALSSPRIEGPGDPAGAMAPFLGFSGSFSAMVEGERGADFPVLACLAAGPGAMCQAGVPDDAGAEPPVADWGPAEPGVCWPDRGGRTASCTLQSRDP